jgi:hypothetical protein
MLKGVEKTSLVTLRTLKGSGGVWQPSKSPYFPDFGMTAPFPHFGQIVATPVHLESTQSNRCGFTGFGVAKCSSLHSKQGNYRSLLLNHRITWGAPVGIRIVHHKANKDGHEKC